MFFFQVLFCLPREDFCSFRGGKTRSPPRQKAMLARMTERNAQTGGIHSKGAYLLRQFPEEQPRRHRPPSGFRSSLAKDRVF